MMSRGSLHYDPVDTPPPTGTPALDELMIADARDGLRPSQMVERRLVFLLKATPLPMSCLQVNAALRAL
jgi:hypothetical protein